MMKIYQKKNDSIEDETVLVQLERRHTLKEDTNEMDLEDNIRKTIRANSLGSFEEGHSSTDIEAATAKKQNKCSRKPTVITESELSSSLLYKNRKAKVNSDDENIEDPKPIRPHENFEDFEPRTLQDPNLKPVPVSNQHSGKKTSCCWYFTIILVICVASLIVMAGIGGIVFMEFFATYNVADIDTSVKDENPSASEEIFQYSSHKQDISHRNEPEIPDNILKDFFENSTLFPLDTDVSVKVMVTTSQPKEDIFHNRELVNSKDSETEMTEHPQTGEHSDIFRNIHDRINSFKVPVSNKFVEIKTDAENQDQSDFKFNYQSVNHNIDKISDGYVDESNKHMIGNESIIEEISNFEAEISNTTDEIFLPERNFNFDEITSLKGFESKTEPVNSKILFQRLSTRNPTEHSVHLLPDVNSLDHTKNAIDDNLEDNLFHRNKLSIDREPRDDSLDNTETSMDHDPQEDSLDDIEFPIDRKAKNEFFNHVKHLTDHSPNKNSLNNKHLIDHNSKDNSLEHTEQSIDYSPKNFFEEIEHSIGHNDQDNSSDHKEHFFDHKDTSLNDHKDFNDFGSDGSSSEGHLLSDDEIKNSNDSAQLVFIRPVVESKAIPVPLAFLRRIGFDIKKADSRQPLSANDMDMKFSLAEALKYLRSLDTDNKIPESREKTVTQKTINKKESNKKKLPLITEREEYLNTLRKRIFEESL